MRCWDRLGRCDLPLRLELAARLADGLFQPAVTCLQLDLTLEPVVPGLVELFGLLERLETSLDLGPALQDGLIGRQALSCQAKLAFGFGQVPLGALEPVLQLVERSTLGLQILPFGAQCLLHLLRRAELAGQRVRLAIGGV